jgi:orotidine-5'-phosphate decarboxylase
VTAPFADRLAEAVIRTGAATCVGLDPHLDALPASLRVGLRVDTPADRAAAAAVVERWSLGVLDAIVGVAAAVKPQVAFFEVLGAPGVAVLERVVAAARARGLLVLLDAKRGDIGTTAEAYARWALDPDGPVAADAVTLSPYLGPESLAPFVARADRGAGLFVLVRTSNPGAGVWQLGGDAPVAGRVADWVTEANAPRRGAAGLGPVGAVVGATLPGEIAGWRERMPDAWLLLPGFGAQGAGPKDVAAAFRPDGLGALVVSARGVTFGPETDDWQAGVAARAQAFARALREG